MSSTGRPASPIGLLTVADVARDLVLRPATVRRMAARGLIGYHRINGKELRFTRADVEALLARTRTEADDSPQKRRPRP